MLINIPAEPVASDIEWTIDQPGQVNRGEWTGRRRVTLLPAAPRWFAKVTLPPITGESRVLDWRAFVVDCDGVANSFRVIACEGDQISGSLDVRVKGGGQGGHALATSGWGSAGLKVRRGQFVTLGDQLLMLNADVIADDSGNATLSVKPYIRIVPADKAPIEVKRPYAVMAMSDPKNGWKVGIGKKYAVSFDCEEAF
jgi:hypothetical protein